MHTQPTAKIEILAYDVRPGKGPLFFNVRNVAGAFKFMQTIAKWSDGRADSTSFGYVFRQERLGNFLAYADKCGVEVVQ